MAFRAFLRRGAFPSLWGNALVQARLLQNKARFPALKRLEKGNLQAESGWNFCARHGRVVLTCPPECAIISENGRKAAGEKRFACLPLPVGGRPPWKAGTEGERRNFRMQLDEFFRGESFDAHRFFGAHPGEEEGAAGFFFRVFAPGAELVEVIGDWNGWQGQPMERDSGGVWSCFAPGAEPGQLYKFRVSQKDGRVLDKADPYAFSAELRPRTASRLTGGAAFRFSDGEWMHRRELNYNRPMSIYELHLGSWKRKPDGGWYRYEELAELLPPYLAEHGFTHVELLPVMEHPLDASWGYQVSGYFCATSRYGQPEGLKRLVNALHLAGIGVIFDFVPAHFAVNDYALACYDGTRLYEYPDGDVTYSEWGSCSFNFYRGEVRSFLQSSAAYWLGEFHGDGLRVDAVPNMLYWQGRPERGVNSGAVDFLKGMNGGLKKLFGQVLLIAEDSSNFPKVTAPVKYGGLGFDYKWDMGWMHDTLEFLALPFARRGEQYHRLTFSMDYFYNELYLLPFSHDEVVHGKKTILDKLYGSYEEKFAQCRALYAYMFTHPGKKLNFMGNELAHFREWDENRELDWNLLQYPAHDSFHRYFAALGRLYAASPALYEGEYDSACFAWLPVSPEGENEGVYAYRRSAGGQTVDVVVNFSPHPLEGALLGCGEQVLLRELLNSDEKRWGGGGVGNPAPLAAFPIPCGGEPASVRVRLAPFSAAVFREEPAPASGGQCWVMPGAKYTTL